MSTVGCRGVLCVGRDNQHQMAQAPPFVLNTSFFYMQMCCVWVDLPHFPRSSVCYSQNFLLSPAHTFCLLIVYFVSVPSSPRSSLPPPRSTISCVKRFHAHPMFPGLSIHFLILKAEVTMMPRERGGSSEQARF